MVVIATNRSQVRSPAAPLSGSNLRQVVYTHLRICLCSPSSINWNRPNVGDALRLGGRVTAGLAERSESCQPPPAAQLSTWVTSSAGWLPENRTSAPTDTVLTDHWTAISFFCPFISKILHNDDANAERLYVVNSELHWHKHCTCSTVPVAGQVADMPSCRQVNSLTTTKSTRQNEMLPPRCRRLGHWIGDASLN